MAPLRSAARGLLALGTKFPAFSPHHAAARTISGTAPLTPASRSSADLPDLEPSTLTAPPPGEDTIKRYKEGVEKGLNSEFDLPHSRYQYHPPKYYRGPLHPVQVPPSSDPTARDFVPGPFNFPRLRQTFETTMSHDILTLSYEHRQPGEPKRVYESPLREWDDSSPYMKNRPKRGPKGGPHLFPIERPITFRNIPQLTEVTMATHVPDANSDMDYLWTAWAAVQAVTGSLPEVFVTKNPVSGWGTKKRKPAGVKATITGDRAYEFVDKLVNFVLPKIKDWDCMNGTSGDSMGNLAFGLDPNQLAYFPEIEVNYEMYPLRLIPGVHIFMKTTAKSDRHARLLLKMMGFPVAGKYVD